MVKYTQNQKGEILKDGHTMFTFDILSDLKRKAFLEEERKNNKQMQTGACACPDPEGCLYLTGTDKLECSFNHGTAD